MPKMHQDTFGGHAPPGPAGGAYALPQIRSEGLLLREWREERGAYAYKGTEGEREGREKERREFLPKVTVSKISTGY